MEHIIIAIQIQITKYKQIIGALINCPTRKTATSTNVYKELDTTAASSNASIIFELFLCMVVPTLGTKQATTVTPGIATI